MKTKNATPLIVALLSDGLLDFVEVAEGLMEVPVDKKEVEVTIVVELEVVVGRTVELVVAKDEDEVETVALAAAFTSRPTPQAMRAPPGCVEFVGGVLDPLLEAIVNLLIDKLLVLRRIQGY